MAEASQEREIEKKKARTVLAVCWDCGSREEPIFLSDGPREITSKLELTRSTEFGAEAADE